MRMYFKQRIFSWFDSYDVYDENGNVLFICEGQLSWGHRINIYDANKNYIATVKEKVLKLFFPEYQFYIGDSYIGAMHGELAFFTKKFNLDFNGWRLDGDFLGWDYYVNDHLGNPIINASKEFFNWSDTYNIYVENPDNALLALMITVAIDIDICSDNNG